MNSSLLQKTDALIEEVINRTQQACQNCAGSEVKVLSEALLILAEARKKISSFDKKTEPPTVSEKINM